MPPTTLATKLTKVMEAISHIPKSGYNEAQRYNYVTDADVLDTIRRELVKQDVAIIAGVTDINTVPFTTAKGSPQFLVTIKGHIRFVDGLSGEMLVAEGVGQGSDSMDKGVYKAITGMTKYILLKTFLVPTGDDPERDDQTSAGSVATPTRTTEGTGSSGEVGLTASPRAGLTPKQRGLLMARFKEVGLENGQRLAFTLDVTGKHSSTQLDSADLDKLLTAMNDADLVAKTKADVKP